MDYVRDYAIRRELVLIARLFSEQISKLPLENKGGEKDGYLYKKRCRNKIRI